MDLCPYRQCCRVSPAYLYLSLYVRFSGKFQVAFYNYHAPSFENGDALLVIRRATQVEHSIGRTSSPATCRCLLVLRSAAQAQLAPPHTQAARATPAISPHMATATSPPAQPPLVEWSSAIAGKTELKSLPDTLWCFHLGNSRFQELSDKYGGLAACSNYYMYHV